MSPHSWLPKGSTLLQKCLLDCTCGIGTQAISLAAHGYRMTGTDLSRTSIARAKMEAQSRGIPITLSVAEVRGLPAQFDQRFKAVISCDNALPHLLSDEDPCSASVSTHQTLVEGGLFIASIRDYDTLRSEHSAGIPPTIMGVHGFRHGYAQAWRWSDDGSRVDISLFVLLETPGGWSASLHENHLPCSFAGGNERRVSSGGVLADQMAHARGHWVLPADRGRSKCP